jgi:hypothetical protein
MGVNRKMLGKEFNHAFSKENIAAWKFILKMSILQQPAT